jgi:nicotinamidase-related amidase
MSKYAILTNDLQYAAANKSEERKVAVEAFLPKQLLILKEMRELNVPVIHLRLINEENDPRALAQPEDLRFTRTSRGSQILNEVLEEGDLIVEKLKDSGFFETTLDQKLKELEVDTIIITGMQTQICVQTTAADGYFRGYKILIPSDCVTSTRADDTKRSLEWMADYCATVVTSEEVIETVKNDTK